MPTKTYYLDEARSELITAQWGWLYRNFKLSYQGQPLAPTEAGASLAQGGYRYELPGGRALTVRLTRNVGLQELELLLAGQPLPGSSTHPLERLKQGWYALLFVGLFSVTFGVLAMAINSDTLRALGLGWSNIVGGLLYLGLGWWAYSRRSAIVFYVAMGLLILDWVATLVTLAEAGGGNGFAGIFLRFFICVLVFRAARAAQQLRREAISADASSRLIV